MAIDEALVRHLELLSALQLGDEERSRLVGHLARVVAYMEKLRELDTSRVAPDGAGTDAGSPRRPDEPRPSLPRAEATANSPAADRDFFVVPPVFGGDGEAGGHG